MSDGSKYCKNGHLRTTETAVFSKDGKYKDCRPCGRLRAKEWFKNNPTKAKEYAARAYKKNKVKHLKKTRTNELKRKYGLSRQQYIALFRSQNYQCANTGCRESVDKTSGHIDHDHITGQVRGILCRKCNWSLGHLDDNPIKIRGLADYLTRSTLAQ